MATAGVLPIHEQSNSIPCTLISSDSLLDRPVAHGQNHCQRGRDDERLAARSGTGVAEITLGQACSAPSNRVVRTRMLRGVEGGRSDPPAYPILHAFTSCAWWNSRCGSHTVAIRGGLAARVVPLAAGDP